MDSSEKPPVLPFCACGIPLPVERYKMHLKTVALFGGLFDTAAATASFVHECFVKFIFGITAKAIFNRFTAPSGAFFDSSYEYFPPLRPIRTSSTRSNSSMIAKNSSFTTRIKCVILNKNLWKD
jgi:hypothetical protein